jgi:maltooligosyltrehalose trehalohydrolase
LGSGLALGAVYRGMGHCSFLVWAPKARRVEIRIVSPGNRLIPMERDEGGYHYAKAEGIEPDALYFYRLDGGTERPDPVSRFQPLGIHGPSCVVDSSFDWSDGDWNGIPFRDYVFYELHVGTFTSEGTFDAVIARLDDLAELGITALELMPVAQFPGERNWGYDGVYPFAVQNSYGGPAGLRYLIDACHRKGLAVVLDVVYNHLGSEGNYLNDYAPYFTDRYSTPWGSAMNFDGPGSDGTRRYFIENALHWIRDFHVDAFRLDAVHGIFDMSARPFLQELSAAVHEEGRRLGRLIHLVAESNLNDPRLIREVDDGGFGLDGLWNDDFHHALHTLLTRESHGYYIDYGRFDQMEKAWKESFVYTGEYSSYHRRQHGRSPRGLPGERFVVFSQNHDQVGNRAQGDRLSTIVSFEALKLAASAVLLSPFTPLLFMGEEYGEVTPFPYFISHSDPGLIEATRRGRLREFEHLIGTPDIPDPQDEYTYRRAKIRYESRGEGQHALLLSFSAELMRLRREFLSKGCLNHSRMELIGFPDERVLYIRYRNGAAEVVIVLSFGMKPVSVTLPFPKGRWIKLLDSENPAWGGRGSGLPGEFESPRGFAITLPGTSSSAFARQTE